MKQTYIDYKEAVNEYTKLEAETAEDFYWDVLIPMRNKLVNYIAEVTGAEKKFASILVDSKEFETSMEIV